LSESTNRKLPTWDDYYKNEKIEKMPGILKNYILFSVVKLIKNSKYY